MPDTRIIARDRQLEYANYFGSNGTFDSVRFATDLADPARQLLGGEQLLWLQQQLAGSTATWQMLGQQVLIGRMNIPAPPAIPYNLDAWDGYAMARETLFAMSRALDKYLVVLAGALQDYLGNKVGVEFAVSSVSSPGLEEYFPSENPALVTAGLESLIGPLVYANTGDRGYMVVTATRSECRCDWHYVNTVKHEEYTLLPGKSLRTLPGAANRRLVAI